MGMVWIILPSPARTLQPDVQEASKAACSHCQWPPCSGSGHTPTPVTDTATDGLATAPQKSPQRSLVLLFVLVVVLFAAAVAGLRAIYLRAQGRHLPARTGAAESAAPAADESRAPTQDH